MTTPLFTARGLTMALLLVLPATGQSVAGEARVWSAQAQGMACPNPVVIQPGDTLFGIARRCGTTVESLLAANPQIGDLGGLRPGLRVFLDPNNLPPSLPNPPDQPRPDRVDEVRTEVYRVRPGDTMAAIAAMAGVKVRILLDLNPSIDPWNLRVGDRIRIPAGVVIDVPRERPEIRLSQSEGTVGSLVDIDARGFPPRAELDVLMGTDPRRLRVVDSITASRRGRAEVSVRIPRWAARERVLYFGFEAAGSNARAVSGPFSVIVERPRDERIRITGTLTREGVECQAMRGDDGQLYTLLGDLDRFRPGDRVRVTGTSVELSYCQQGVTIEVDRIRRD